jgi:pimeloyl-ACP methyl ester carboxylesterase
MDFIYNKEASINVGKVSLPGELVIPSAAKGVVIFSHGSGSSRLSIRNQMVAKYLHRKNFGTLLFDLLTEHEDKEVYNRFNIDLLTRRLISVTQWLKQQPGIRDFSIGYFGASTGAASALKAAAVITEVQAVVSRGGSADLAYEDLLKVKAPTLLIVGSLDHDVLLLNKKAYRLLGCEKKLEIVEGATHLFEERGTMEKVCELAAEWFEINLKPVVIEQRHTN